jgi:predicted secreted hydrolase
MTIKTFKLLNLLMIFLCLTTSACGRKAQETGDLTGIRLLAEAPEDPGFARATTPREFRFPRDHGAHEEFATEWWYFTGNVYSPSNRHFGFELTFFRYALSAEPVERESAWASNQVWLAHFAITDTARRNFYADERLGRGVARIAGSRKDRLDVHVRDWWARQADDSATITLDAGTDTLHLRLDLTEAAPITANGAGGLDPKGSAPGNASYYYSIPRLDAVGTIRLPDETPIEVTGTAWLDREWATSSLDPGVEGWDWFGLQLDDGTNLMLYRLRDSSGAMTPFSTGTIVRADGETETIEPESIEYRVTRRWRSSATGVTYPVAWDISIPRYELDLSVETRLDDQEIRLGLRYWEGAVKVRGDSAGRSVEGVGYLELAGYR